METKEQHVDLLNLILRGLAFFRRRILLIAIVFVLGIIIGMIDYFLSEDEFETQFVISSPMINSSIVSALTEPLIYFIGSNSNDSISHLMGVDMATASQINKMEQDTSIPQVVMINVKYSDRNLIDSIKNGLVYFYNNIPFVKNQIEKQKKDLAEYISVLEIKIDELDQIQGLELEALKEGRIQDNDSKGHSFDEIVLLYEKLFEVKNEYSQLKPFSVINDSLISRKTNSLVKTLVFFGIGALIIGIFIACLAEIRRLLKRFRKKS